MKHKMEKRHAQPPFDNNQQNMSFSTKKQKLNDSDHSTSSFNN